MGKEILERKFKQDKITFNSENLVPLLHYFKLPTVSELYFQIATEKIDKTKLNIAEIIEYTKARKQEESQQQTHKKEHKVTGNLAKDAVIIGDDIDLPYSFAKCCSPIPGDDIFGFVTVGEGVKIHRTNCTNAISLMSNYGYRIIKAKWANSSLDKSQAFITNIKISGIDSVGIVSTIADIISKQLQINMHAISVSSKEGMFEGSIELEVYDTNQLEELMNKIKASSALIKVYREDMPSAT
jgi:GTP pyrophosphokinase